MQIKKNPDNNISIWGTGSVGKKCYLQLKSKYNIMCFYDNNHDKINEIIIDNIKIKEFKKGDFFIVIASSYWREIVDQLIGEGLCIFNDFIPYFMLDSNIDMRFLKSNFNSIEINTYIRFIKNLQKIVVVYGNCQTSILEKMLLRSKQFRNDYFALIFPRVCDYSGKDVNEFIYDFAWEEVDLFIYQEISENNKFSEQLATDRIKKLLPTSCRTVCITNLFFTGYFPQTIQNKNNVYHELHQSGMFPFGDKYIDQLVGENRKYEEIIEIVNNPKFLDSIEIIEQCENSFSELIKREKVVDVKISDYIIANYKAEQLFYSFNHPNNIVLYEYTNRILKFLGYNVINSMTEEDMYCFFGSLKGQDIPIYPSVIETLGLRKYENNFFPNKYVLEKYYLSFNEFIKEYIDQCLN